MKQETGLFALRALMNWDHDTAEREFKRLSFLAEYKYDEYADFIAGSRFLENLVRWLQQFDSTTPRAVAYNFIARRLIFVTNSEMERLVEQFFPRTLFYDTLNDVAQTLNCKQHEVLLRDDGKLEFEREIRKTLIVGMSDGARVDVLRRLNVGRLVNDQVLVSMDADQSRWKSAQRKLAASPIIEDPAALFNRVYLIDDFTASGTTLCRRAGNEWDGKLFRFLGRFRDEAGRTISADATVGIHHFLGTEQAKEQLEGRIATAGKDHRDAKGFWFRVDPRLSFGHLIQDDVRIMKGADGDDDAFLQLCDDHYDKSIEKPEHDQVELQHGYKGGALPLVLQHNTPNNSFTLLHKESTGADGPVMRALFRRRDRH